jgi:hypothetical protein
MKRLFALLVLIFAAWACELWWPQIRNELFVIVGNRDETGGWYGFWSGFAGGVRVFEWPVIGALVYYHHSCADHAMCLRWGKYPAAGGLFHLCARHHPDFEGAPLHRDLIKRLHDAHKGIGL